MRMRLPRWVSEMTTCLSGSKKAISPLTVPWRFPLASTLAERRYNTGSEETDVIAEEFVVEKPTLQLVDRRGLGFLILAMDDKQAEKVPPSGFQETGRICQEPHLMLVPLIIRSPAQFGRWLREDEFLLGGVGPEDGEFFEVMGRTALKTRNCLAAASELVNVCLERESRSSVIWFMAGHSVKSFGRSRRIPEGPGEGDDRIKAESSATRWTGVIREKLKTEMEDVPARKANNLTPDGKEKGGESGQWK